MPDEPVKIAVDCSGGVSAAVGVEVPLSAEEIAQRDDDTAAWAVIAAEIAVAEGNEATLRGAARDALANLKAADDNWATLTAAQKDAALHLAVKVERGLIRLILRELASAD